MSAAAAPLGYAFSILMDNAEDYAIENRAHLAMPLATTAADAPRVLVECYIGDGDLHPMDDELDPTTFVCEGTVWLIATLETDGRTLRGHEAEQAVLDDLDAGGELAFSLQFATAEPGEPGALEWWKIERVEACHHLIEETDDGDLIHCTLPDGHSVPVDRSQPAHEVQPWIWPR